MWHWANTSQRSYHVLGPLEHFVLSFSQSLCCRRHFPGFHRRAQRLWGLKGSLGCVCISLGGGALSPWVRRPAHPPLLHVGASGSHCSPPLPALLSAVLIGGVFHPWNQMLQKVPLETEEFRGHCSDRPPPDMACLPTTLPSL